MAKLIFKKSEDKLEKPKTVDIEALMKEVKELKDEYNKILALDTDKFLSEEVRKRSEFIERRMIEIAKIMKHN